MATVAEFPYFPVQFNKEAVVHDQSEQSALEQFLAQGNTTDLVVISHGWNNDMQEAQALYADFLTLLRQAVKQASSAGLAGRTFAVMGVLWPSKKFADEELIPSGAAGVGAVIDIAVLRNKLDSLKGVFDDPNADQRLEELKKLLPKLEDSAAARKEFANKARALVSKRSVDELDGSVDFFTLPADDLLNQLSNPISFIQPVASTEGGGAAAIGVGGAARVGEGGAAGIGEFFSGLFSGVRNLLNYTTYYQMKERAGLIGSKGINPLLRQIKEQHSTLKLHLIGHSFGGRLVTAAVAGLNLSTVVKVETLTLLQAAFSHYGFAEKWDGRNDGFFRRVVTTQAVAGPILVSHTPNDRAVGIAYPMASLIAGQVAAGIGDKDSKYGGIGRNGIQKTPEAVDGNLLPVGGAYQFKPGKFFNLSADNFIEDHSDICKKEIAYAIVTAIAGV
jgi:hypothetical protein